MNRESRLGARAERNFRLVFISTTISAVGDGVASIALVFAVLQISNNSPTAVGIVIASRQVAAVAITLAAGTISLACSAIVIAQPSVWAIGNRPVPAPA